MHGSQKSLRLLSISQSCALAATSIPLELAVLVPAPAVVMLADARALAVLAGAPLAAGMLADAQLVAPPGALV